MFYKIPNYDKPIHVHTFLQLQESIFFIEEKNIWCFADMSHNLQGFKLVLQPDPVLLEEFSFQVHTEKITGFIYLQHSNLYVPIRL